jgi:hypothetical protein
VLVAASSAAGFGNDDALVGAGEVVNKLAAFSIVKLGADGDLESDIAPFASGAVGAHSVLAALALVFGVVAEVQEGVVALGRFHNDVAATSAVSAGRAAAGDEFFSTEGHASITSVTGFYANFRFVNEHL